MYKKIFGLLLIISNLITVSSALAMKPEHVYSLPASAVEVSQGVFSLGTAYDKASNSFVEGYAIVHKNDNAKSSPAKGGPKAPSCYGFLAAGAKWKGVENWSVFPGAGLNESFLLSTTGSDIAKWETAAAWDILGAGSLGSGTPGDPNVLDDKNEVSFGSMADNNTIAVTIVWGTFSGPTFNRQLVAWDQIFNTHYAWSASGETNKMDYENISTHELGHAVGMDDIYNSSCSTVTMYGYASEGDTNKRDLAQPDITGVSTLY